MKKFLSLLLISSVFALNAGCGCCNNSCNKPCGCKDQENVQPAPQEEAKPETQEAVAEQK